MSAGRSLRSTHPTIAEQTRQVLTPGHFSTLARSWLVVSSYPAVLSLAAGCCPLKNLAVAAAAGAGVPCWPSWTNVRLEYLAELFACDYESVLGEHLPGAIFIRVIDLYSIKPVDAETLRQATLEAGTTWEASADLTLAVEYADGGIAPC